MTASQKERQEAFSNLLSAIGLAILVFGAVSLYGLLAGDQDMENAFGAMSYIGYVYIAIGALLVLINTITCYVLHRHENLSKYLILYRYKYVADFFMMGVIVSFILNLPVAWYRDRHGL